jgi:hypothetical protein
MDFLKSLEEMTLLYQRLNEILRLERDSLIDADLEALKEQTKAKEALLYKIRNTEKMRQLAAMSFAKSKGFVGVDVRLLALADRCEDLGDKPLATQLRDRHKVLQIQVEQAQEQNKENEVYASAALRILDGAVKDITQTVTEKPTYGKKGQMAGTTETQSGNFVKREA